MPSGLLLFATVLFFFFFHWEWGKPCNNGGLLMESGSEDVVLVIQRSQGCESPQSGTFQLAALLPPGHWLCVTLTVLRRFTFDFYSDSILIQVWRCWQALYEAYRTIGSGRLKVWKLSVFQRLTIVEQCGKPLEVLATLEFIACSVKQVLLDSCARIGSSLPSSMSVMSEARSQMSAFDEKTWEGETKSPLCADESALSLFSMSTLPQASQWQNNGYPLCLKILSIYSKLELSTLSCFTRSFWIGKVWTSNGPG